jgi:hypothetical protein
MTTQAALAQTIDAAFEDRAKFAPGNAPADVVAAVNSAIALLDSGAARVAESGVIAWSMLTPRARACAASSAFACSRMSPRVQSTDHTMPFGLSIGS